MSIVEPEFGKESKRTENEERVSNDFSYAAARHYSEAPTFTA